MALIRRAPSVYEEMKHPNEESEHDMTIVGITDEKGQRIGWTASSLYTWFVEYDERVLKPFFIRNYDPDVVVLEDEYQQVLKLQFEEGQELADLAERVDVIKRTTSVAAVLEKAGRTQSRFMSTTSFNARSQSTVQS